MALARTYNPATGRIQVTLDAVYRDRLSRESDIREYLPLLREHATKAQTVLELGTRKGYSTLAFLAGVAAHRGHVWSVDIDPCDQRPDGMGPYRTCPLWTFIRGDDLHPAILAATPKQVDLLFCDTSHFYAETLAECRAYVPRVRPGGVALFHDTNLFPWTAQGGPASAPEVPPVRQALDDWCAETGLAWEDLPGDYGLGRISVA